MVESVLKNIESTAIRFWIREMQLLCGFTNTNENILIKGKIFNVCNDCHSLKNVYIHAFLERGEVSY